MARHRLCFAKEGRGIYLSHLDLMRTMQRAFQRAGLRIRHTEGFNPHPYISVALPLSVGVESQVELLDFELISPADVSLHLLPARLTEKLPQGITVLEAYEAERKVKEIAWLGIRGVLEYDRVPDMAEMARELGAFFGQKEILVKKRTKKGEETELDIVPLIKEIQFTPQSPTEIALEMVAAAQNPPLNPGLLLEALRREAEGLSPDFAMFSRQALYDREMQVFR